jgi:hypothetical protein
MRVNVNVTVADAAWTLTPQSQNTSPLVMSMPASSADSRIRVARRFAGLLDVFIGFPLLVRPPARRSNRRRSARGQAHWNKRDSGRKQSTGQKRGEISVNRRSQAAELAGFEARRSKSQARANAQSRLSVESDTPSASAASSSPSPAKKRSSTTRLAR